MNDLDKMKKEVTKEANKFIQKEIHKILDGLDMKNLILSALSNVLIAECLQNKVTKEYFTNLISLGWDNISSSWNDVIKEQ